LKDSFEVFVTEDEGKTVGFNVFKMESHYIAIENIIVAKEEK
jgi:hypothetical protein